MTCFEMKQFQRIKKKSGEKKRRFKNVLNMKKEFDKRITILFKKKEKEDE